MVTARSKAPPVAAIGFVLEVRLILDAFDGVEERLHLVPQVLTVRLLDIALRRQHSHGQEPHR